METNNRFDVSGKAIMITGASSGLGRHFAAVLSQCGARVAVCARRVDRLEDLCKEISRSGGRAVPVALDVASADSVTKAVKVVVRELGSIDVLVNNAGVAITKSVLEVDEHDWDSVMDINLKGAWRVAQETARQMSRAHTGGSIINIASITGFRVAGQISTYAVSKAALIHLTRAMSLELARFRVRVNAIAPGYIETDLNREFFESPAGEAMIKRVPQRRLGRLDELDGSLLLLASDASSYMTGSVIVVDGGHLQASL